MSKIHFVTKNNWQPGEVSHEKKTLRIDKIKCSETVNKTYRQYTFCDNRLPNNNNNKMPSRTLGIYNVYVQVLCSD